MVKVASAAGFGVGTDDGAAAAVVVCAGAGASEDGLTPELSPGVELPTDWLTEGELGGCEAAPPELHPAAVSTNNKLTPAAPNFVIPQSNPGQPL